MSKWQAGLCVLMIPLFLTVSLEARASTQFSGRRGVATVIFCGLGGAVAGLSTLSFYGSPQDHTGNIYAGLGLGLIAGLAYVVTEPTPMSYERSGLGGAALQRLSDFKNLTLQSRSAFANIQIAAYRWEF